MPQRQVYELRAGDPSHNAFAVLPAWNDDVIALKAFTYFPDNQRKNLATLFSKIMLFSRKTGEPLALIDGTSVTYWRTAAVSALASRYLSRADSEHLLFVGSGNLAPYMIAAHLSVRDISQVSIWARNEPKVLDLIKRMKSQYPNVAFDLSQSLQQSASTADIISCATGSSQPLILGEWLKPGCHLDLVGNHHADGRECDSFAVERSRVFVDSYVNVLKEAGEILLPIAEGCIDKSHVQGELADLTKGASARNSPQDITLFKSVGTALSDLIAANLVYRQL